MAGEASGRSPWAKRLAIAGALFLILGAILLSSQDEAIDAVTDPRVISIAELQDDASANFMVEEKGCYMAVVKTSAPAIEVTLTPIIGSAAASEELEPKTCFSDWTPMASDGVTFEIHEQWVAQEDGEMTASSTCSKETCEEYTVWMVHIEETWPFEYFEYSGLIFGLGICCLGFIFLPIAGLLAYTARSNAVHGSFRIVGEDGELLHTYENQDDLLLALKDKSSPLHQNAEQSVQQENTDQGDGFVDGSNDVMQGTMMTTEQVYAFVRGDSPEAVEMIEDPFADTATPIQKSPVKRKAVNTSEISNWDTGGDEDVGKKTKSLVQSKAKQSKEKKSESSDWSVWDDM